MVLPPDTSFSDVGSKKLWSLSLFCYYSSLFFYFVWLSHLFKQNRVLSGDVDVVDVYTMWIKNFLKVLLIDLVSILGPAHILCPHVAGMGGGIKKRWWKMIMT